MSKITVSANINSPINEVWEKWTNPTHVLHWNFAHESWHCPKATADLQVGGEFHYLMAAKDASFEFDFWGTFQEIEKEKYIKILLGDGREMEVFFHQNVNRTEVSEVFDPENQNPHEMQQQGWQSILNQFKKYVVEN
ncbi:hypothetical protein EOJ36_09265 [Sandaracinomonas limnophila]|uniref:Activator of Hsp90 ATPase homologue 1/2-like C-terminal domain-containing protein n=1 Tax=Sandaracinomonas limnophila TaxID=1862386 RepID=A0A437PPE5_9BACT|nr:SRPBCC domain-containing protein [Sandaracinomonas limnophila]RVU24107.1 hypothetical protein EOJ36_09265 [Sandaracinomonas limnophila]